MSPMVIRLISVSEQLQLPEFHDIFRAILGWDGDLGYIIRIHGQEFSLRRKGAIESSTWPGRTISGILYATTLRRASEGRGSAEKLPLKSTSALGSKAARSPKRQQIGWS